MFWFFKSIVSFFDFCYYFRKYRWLVNDFNRWGAIFVIGIIMSLLKVMNIVFLLFWIIRFFLVCSILEIGCSFRGRSFKRENGFRRLICFCSFCLFFGGRRFEKDYFDEVRSLFLFLVYLYIVSILFYFFFI